MAGRGCVIHVQLLRAVELDHGGTAAGTAPNNDRFSLPVALHSPLELLRTELHRITNIEPHEQVLILCNFSDPERNSDVLLTSERDAFSLRECGIRPNAILTLHALGLSAERQMRLMAEAFQQPQIATMPTKRSHLKGKDVHEQAPVHLLTTAIGPAEANHSYNGVIFDLEVKGPNVVEIHSLSMGGMLGFVRIFARDRPWEVDNEDESQQVHWWAHQEAVSSLGWQLVATATCLPSWDKPFEIVLQQPFRMLPHSRHGFYCHSSLPDDLGIQYQGYAKNDIVAEDGVIIVHPGLGHTGAEPFDNERGWYRSYRGPAGNISYRARTLGWSLTDHNLFPAQLREAVVTMLLCHNRQLRDGSYSKPNVGNDNKASVAVSEGEIDSNVDNNNDGNNQLSSSQPISPRSSSLLSNLIGKPLGAVANRLSFGRFGRRSANDDSNHSSVVSSPATSSKGSLFQHSSSKRIDVSSNISKSTATTVCVLYSLPKHVLYNILEYMNWDWYDNLTPRSQSRRSNRRERQEHRQTTSHQPNQSHIVHFLAQLLGVHPQNLHLNPETMALNILANRTFMAQNPNERNEDDDDGDGDNDDGDDGDGDVDGDEVEDEVDDEDEEDEESDNEDEDALVEKQAHHVQTDLVHIDGFDQIDRDEDDDGGNFDDDGTSELR